MSDVTEAPKPEVTRNGILSMQVCVPAGWTDEQVEHFANKENPAGTSGGWGIRKEGDKWLSGCPERVQCEQRAGCVHIMLDC